MLMTGSDLLDAERAFTRASRARRRAALTRWLRRERSGRGDLAVYDERGVTRASARPGGEIRAIPLDAIQGTLEPSKAMVFDRRFRPAASARRRWERVWLAEHRGSVLPPISVVPVGDAYAISDGHHRVSVAAARGALTIDALVDAAPAA